MVALLIETKTEKEWNEGRVAVNSLAVKIKGRRCHALTLGIRLLGDVRQRLSTPTEHSASDARTRPVVQFVCLAPGGAVLVDTCDGGTVHTATADPRHTA